MISRTRDSVVVSRTMARASVTIVTPPRRRGPKPISTSGAPAADVHVKLDPIVYDRAFRAASRDRVSVPEVLRRALVAWLPRHEPREARSAIRELEPTPQMAMTAKGAP